MLRIAGGYTLSETTPYCCQCASIRAAASCVNRSVQLINRYRVETRHEAMSILSNRSGGTEEGVVIRGAAGDECQIRTRTHLVDQIVIEPSGRRDLQPAAILGLDEADGGDLGLQVAQVFLPQRRQDLEGLPGWLVAGHSTAWVVEDHIPLKHIDHVPHDPDRVRRINLFAMGTEVGHVCRAMPASDGGWHPLAVGERYLTRLGYEVIVANARRVRMISESSRKTTSWTLKP